MVPLSPFGSSTAIRKVLVIEDGMYISISRQPWPDTWEYPDTVVRPFFTSSLECIAALASGAISVFQFQGRLERSPF